VEWRIASFNATEIFRGNGHRLSLYVQRGIWKFFGYLQIKDLAAEEVGKKKLKESCDAAVDFTLLTKKLKDNFKVDDLARSLGKPMSDWDEFAEELATVPVRNEEQAGTIAYVMFGALIKYPRENLGKKLVLLKAEVAVYRQKG
jgi:hypothetical protein